jgi:uncharacterized OsmC-like protein
MGFLLNRLYNTNLIGFKAIRLSFILNCDATTEQIQSLAKLTERYCVVYQTLMKGVQIETTFNKQ